MKIKLIGVGKMVKFTRAEKARLFEIISKCVEIGEVEMLDLEGQGEGFDSIHDSQSFTVWCKSKLTTEAT